MKIAEMGYNHLRAANSIPPRNASYKTGNVLFYFNSVK